MKVLLHTTQNVCQNQLLASLPPGLLADIHLSSHLVGVGRRTVMEEHVIIPFMILLEPLGSVT